MAPLGNQALWGQPDFTDEGIGTFQGQSADSAAYLVNSAQDSVTLLSASLIPIKGHRTGRLVLLQVSVNGNVVAGRGWPVPGIVTRPFRAARLPHGDTTIIFGFAGDRAGVNYMTAGLRIVYRYHGQLYTILAWSAAAACVSVNWRTGNLAACGRAQQVVRRATEHLAGVQSARCAWQGTRTP